MTIDMSMSPMDDVTQDGLVNEPSKSNFFSKANLMARGQEDVNDQALDRNQSEDHDI